MRLFNGALRRYVIPLFLFLLSFNLLVDIVHAQGPECSAKIPCKNGCCSKYGFCGYGKDYCKKDVCLNNCDRLAECDPGGFGKEYVKRKKCPLNVCCSKHGFCGTTEEFCGSKKVTVPACSSHSLQRVVGYYEGWAPERPCNTFVPEQIPLGVYTHLNFAFATIDPKTFEVRPASASDTKMYRRLTSLKRQDPDLKVLIAIGGWTFNDPGPTATTFSDIARSDSAQKAFIKSLISLMSTYDFDGVDLDWEYPEAKDRSGREEDFANFPKFIANLKNALKSTGGRDIITLTLPASFWYLQHFDIVKLEKNVDFFNIMSYDLHGTWDKTNEWVGPYLNAHTNLTEIKEAMNLLWRNDINPDKVVLGTGFYGRSFTATSPNCLSPGCTYESGGPRQPCSGEVSVMIQSEIVDVMKRTGRTPVLDKKAAVKILTFDSNQWVAFDDEDTFKMKADFAREQCLSGIMVWAVSQDVKDGKYSRAIGRAAGRKYTSLPDVDFGSTTPDDGLIKTVTKHPQCKWTNCGESCPANWIRMTRNDKEARKGEYMTDDTYCSEGFHQLCCPPEGDTPTCGWYQHNGGKCNSQCPDGTVEVGSLSKHCNNKKYQAACCTTGGTNMKLYNQCSWSESYPNCDSGQCSSGNKEIVKSSSGSGAVGMCKVRKTFSNGGKDAEERKYCCAQTDNQEWSDCEWYRDLGPGSGDEDFCRSGCPSDRVRVAMSGAFHFLDETNCRRGAMANCCIPKHSTISKRESAKDEILRDALTQFMKSPVCVDDDMGFKSLSIRDTNTSIPDAKSELRDDSAKETSRLSHLHKHLHGRSSHPHSLEHRHHHEHHTRNIQPRSSYEKNTIMVLVSELLMGLATLNQIGIWDAIVPKTYPNLKWSSIEAWVRKEDAMERYGRSQLAYLITCDMADFDDWVGGSGTHHCECDTPACCIDGGDYCVEEDSDPELDSSSLEARHLARDDSYMALDERAGKRSRPGEPRNYTVPFPNGSGPPVELESLRYYPGTDRYWRNTGIWDRVYLMYRDDCLDPSIHTTRVVPPGYHLEHIVEMNTIARFFRDAMLGVLPSGRSMRTGRISESLVRRTLMGPYQHLVPPPMPGGQNSNLPRVRLYNALGSEANTQHMVILQGGVNFAKSAMWHQQINGTNLVPGMFPRNMETRLGNLNDPRFLQTIRTVIASVNYLADRNIWRHLVAQVQDVREEMERLQVEHQAATGIQDDLVDAWDEWITDLLQSTVRTAQEFTRRWVREGRNRFAGDNTEEAIQFLARLSTLLRYAFDLDAYFDYNDLTP